MALVAPINLPYNVRTLWFDPEDIDIKAGDKVVVKTARGIELGVADSDIIDVPYEQIANLKSPLKPVLRLATEEDIEKAEEMDRLSKEAMPIFKELAHETSENMHPVSVEYLLDGDKAVFYFEAEDRIDFRDLVKKLATKFHVRVDMHQIGVRDEARIVGGLAHCGQEVCCKRLGGDFEPVTIRMAKDQDLSLNPQKISGLCGRLMCCLRYENEIYKDFKKRSPKVGSKVETPDGIGNIVDTNPLRETVSVKIEDGAPIKIDLSDLLQSSETKEGKTYRIDQDVWDEAHAEDEISLTSAGYFQTSQFTGTDKIGEAKVHYNEELIKKKSEPTAHNRQSNKPEASKPKQKRRRSITLGKDKVEKTETSTEKNNDSSKQKSTTKTTKGSQNNKVTLRPGYKSSSLSSHNRSSSSDGKPDRPSFKSNKINHQSGSQRKDKQNKGDGSNYQHRRKRVRKKPDNQSKER